MNEIKCTLYLSNNTKTDQERYENEAVFFGTNAQKIKIN